MFTVVGCCEKCPFDSLVTLFSELLKFFMMARGCTTCELKAGKIISDSLDHIFIQKTAQQTITLKMADQGRCDFYVVFTMSLCAL